MNIGLWFRGKDVVAEAEKPEAKKSTPPPACRCQHRYGHREHAADCPRREEEAKSD